MWSCQGTETGIRQPNRPIVNKTRSLINRPPELKTLNEDAEEFTEAQIESGERGTYAKK